MKDHENNLYTVFGIINPKLNDMEKDIISKYVHEMISFGKTSDYDLAANFVKWLRDICKQNFETEIIDLVKEQLEQPVLFKLKYSSLLSDDLMQFFIDVYDTCHHERFIEIQEKVRLFKIECDEN